MRSSAPTLIALLAILVALGPSVGLVAASGGSGPPTATADDTLEGARSPPGLASDARARSVASVPNLTRPDPEVVITINLTSQGDARWTIASRFNVSNETEVAAFNAYVETVKEGGANEELGYSAEQFQRFADLVQRGTNRSEDMVIRNDTWAGGVQNGTGTIELSLVWTNFARTDPTSNEVILDDVFAASNGTWFGELADGQRLIINAPSNYGVDSSRFPVDSGTIVLDGPRDLDTGDSPIVYVPVNTRTPPTSTSTTTRESNDMLVIGGGFVGIVLVVVLVAFLYTRRSRAGRGHSTPTPGSTDGGETATPLPESDTESAETATPMPGAGSEPRESTPASEEESGGTVAGAVANDEPATEAEADVDEEIDIELLSDEERVERLLTENGGRMKQANIVSETGWSNAKVSQLLSSMDEDDRIDKLRIGRENLITLPDEDVGEVD